MSDRRTWRRVATIGAGVVATAPLAAHAAPSVANLTAAGRLLWPTLIGVGDRRHVALTFDDGPDPASTPQILDELARLGWSATFFMLGSMVVAAPTLAAEVAAAGHEVAVHGHTHRSHLARLPGDVRDDIRRARDVIADAAGASPTWFRPPYGHLSLAGHRSAGALGLQTVLWSAWGRDWRTTATAESVAHDVGKGWRPGATVLLHDSDCTSAPRSWASTLGSLRLLREYFDEQGATVGALRDHGLAHAGSVGRSGTRQ